MKYPPKKRIEELDFLKGIAIICVVVGHVHLFSRPPGGVEDWTYRVIYAFHMPLFMMISGLLSAQLFERDALQTIVSRFRRMIIPCLVWQAVTIAVVHTYRLGDILNEYWYVKCLFVSVCLTVIASRIFRSPAVSMSVSLFLTWFLPVIWNLPYMYPFFVLGLAVGRRGWLQVLNRHTGTAIILCAVLEVVLLWFWEGRMSMDFSRFELRAWQSPTYWYDLYCLLYRLAIAVNSCVLLYCLSVRLLRHVHCNLVGYIGRESLGIYLIHSIVLNRLLAWDTGLPKPLSVLVVSLVVLTISILVCRVIALNSRLSKYMLGRKRNLHSYIRKRLPNWKPLSMSGSGSRPRCRWNDRCPGRSRGRNNPE